MRKTADKEKQMTRETAVSPKKRDWRLFFRAASECLFAVAFFKCLLHRKNKKILSMS